MPRIRNAAAILLAALYAGPQAASAETIQVTMQNLVFSPIKAKAKVGDTIEWINKDILLHSATARNGDWDVTIAANKIVTLVLKKAGDIDYYCRFHPNMKGHLTITPE